MARHAPIPRRSRSRDIRRAAAGALAVAIAVTLAATALPFCVIFAAGMFPGVIAILVDRHPHFYLGRTVGAMNLAGMTAPVLMLLSDGGSLAAAEQVLSEPTVWLVTYGGAGLGWIIYHAMPPLAAVFAELRATGLRRRLEQQMEELIEEWGGGIKGDGIKGERPSP